MIEIIPAVLAKNFKELQEQVGRVRGLSKVVQIDAVDGEYARPKSWPYRDSGTFDKIVAEEHGLPFWDEFDFQFDLMISNPFDEIPRFAQAGASTIIIHASSRGAPEALRRLDDMRGDSGAFVLRSGLALAAHDTPDILSNFEAQYDFVQVMGIEHEGKQGEPFDPDNKALYLVDRLHKMYPALPIQVDGAAAARVEDLVAAGASRLVIGSAIMSAEDPQAAYKELYTRANGGSLG